MGFTSSHYGSIHIRAEFGTIDVGLQLQGWVKTTTRLARRDLFGQRKFTELFSAYMQVEVLQKNMHDTAKLGLKI